MNAMGETTILAIITATLALFAWVLTRRLYEVWLEYRRATVFAKQKYVVLEIKIPSTLERGPAAMETVLNYLHQTGGEGNWYDIKWVGKTRPWFSLELCSINGNVRFFIWTRESWKQHVERSIYAQYPTVEISVVDDYTHGIFYDPAKIEAWGCYQVLSKPDPYPIKTYVDYGLDKLDLDEDSKVNPFSNVIEFLGSLNYGENIWIQIMIRGHKKVGATDSWADGAKDEIKKIREGAKKDGVNVSKADEVKIQAIEKSVSKPGFDCGIRIIHYADKDKFNGINNSTITGIYKMFNSTSLNGFKPAGGNTSIDFWWTDIGGKKAYKIKKNLFDFYKQRSYFYAPFAGSDALSDTVTKQLKHSLPFEKFFFPGSAYADPFVLNTEELATIYHFPSRITQTPSFNRIQSRKAEPPQNLPI